MLKVLAQTFLGLGLAFAGIYLFFYYLMGIDTGRSPLLVIPSILLVIGGIFFLIRAGKSNASTFSLAEEHKSKAEIAQVKIDAQNLLERNNKFTAEWKKTNDVRDHLKMLQISGNAEEEK